jgi:quinol monooxygenase YgiN
MLHVLAYITAKPGMRETVLREFRANMPAVHAEEACIEYVPVVDLPAAFGPS